ncbi:MAG: multifunctional 2-oxoglutarate metabolism enzyme, partial [Kribbellaceae bacterium]|nr:multifunctional 2-oxoglutarate metabolism enzyme [Kribbellaceae bacterium]
MATEPSESDPFAAFGANEWLADEMYESYLSDPKSVDPAWIKYFESDSFKGNSPGDAKPVTSSPADAPRPDAVSDNKTPEAPSRGTAAAAPASSQPAAQAAALAPSLAAPDAGAAATPAQPAAGQQPAAAQAKQPQPAASPQKAAPAGGGVPTGGTVNQPTSAQPKPAPATAADSERRILRGAPARTAQNMETSLTVPTATSVRQVPVKLLIDNRIVINNHLRRARGGKISFTHLVGWALVKALKTLPEMNASYDVTEGKPTLVQPEHINLGLAIDMQKPDGTRQLLVPSIKATESMTFAQFWMAYEDVVRRARDNKLALPDFQGTTISLTNPGTIGTQHSVPRLMSGQGCIIGVGAMEYPTEYQGAAEETMAKLAVSKVMTLTSTYDHRIIQGAQSGEFLRRLHRLLLGDEGFYDEIFQSLRIPYEPIRWAADLPHSHEEDISKQARILELIHAYRVRGHIMADTDPLEYKQRSHPDLDVATHGLTLWDLDREFATGSFGEQSDRRFMKLRDILGILRDSYCRTTGIEYMHIQDPEQRKWIQERVERPHTKPPREEQLRILAKLNEAEAFET